ncbi:MAG: Endoribonuclease YbeY [Anaerolineales bacterium]|nr:Endoribonuclease YbeY [Anaerolineales bacterium]
MDDAPQIDIQVDEQFAAAVDLGAIERQVARTLSTVAPEEPAALTVVITDNATIQRLNRQYLGVDAPTDVLAFSHGEGAAMPSVDAGPRYLGDIIVSYERALAQATEYDEPAPRELSRLIIHGMLHLLGYDDQHAADREEMWEVQEQLLARPGAAPGEE